MPYKHISVMPKEALDYLNCSPGKIYVDCTLGGSGHAQAILKKILPNGLLLGIDLDKDAINNAKQILKQYKAYTHFFHDNFANLPTILAELNIASVDGIFVDLGLSLHQLASSGRGFSFKADEPLDMRMNTESSMKAEDVVNKMTEKELTKIFWEYGEERWAKRIAWQIVKTRKNQAIRTSMQLSKIVCSAIPQKALYRRHIHPATKTFMAIRIAVNHELENLDLFMKHAVDLLNSKGRLCVLSFHSLEDRIVKRRIKILEKGCICPTDFPKCVCNHKKTVRSLTKKVLKPTDEEIAINPMARSAKLRALEKI